MTKGTFQKVEKSKKRMYGPPGVLVCGHPPGEQSSLISLLEQNGFEDLPAIFVADEDSARLSRRYWLQRIRPVLEKGQR